jgi:release factor glutamine methyltransferase
VSDTNALAAGRLATVAHTVASAVSAGCDQLTAAGCDTPHLDSELLLAEALGTGRERLVIDRHELLTPAAWARFETLLARRRAREPVAYILGRKEFRRITLRVDRRVLIPRPETELLVEIGAELPAGALVADVGTGSGAVALALKDERPDLLVVGLELDPGALEVARGNALSLGLEVEFVGADLLDGRRYGAVLANLPYVQEGAALAPEIAAYEPGRALFAGPAGLDVVHRLVDQVAVDDSRPELLALEIAPQQGQTVAEMVHAAGYGSVSVRRDLAGHERVVVGRA